MKKEITNKAASIRARLFNIAKTQNIEFDFILLRYFQERFLYRLSISPYSNKFVLKGGLLRFSGQIDHRLGAIPATVSEQIVHHLGPNRPPFRLIPATPG